MGGSSSGDDFDVDGDVEGNQIGDKFRTVSKQEIQNFKVFLKSLKTCKSMLQRDMMEDETAIIIDMESETYSDSGLSASNSMYHIIWSISYDSMISVI